jgi:hypothetical protein
MNFYSDVLKAQSSLERAEIIAKLTWLIDNKRELGD